MWKVFVHLYCDGEHGHAKVVFATKTCTSKARQQEPVPDRPSLKTYSMDNMTSACRFVTEGLPSSSSLDAERVGNQHAASFHFVGMTSASIP